MCVAVVVVVVVILPLAVDVQHRQIDGHLSGALSLAQHFLRVDNNAAPDAVAEACPIMHHAPVALVRAWNQVNGYKLATTVEV